MIRSWTRILLRRARFVLVAGILATIAAAAYGVGVFGELGEGGFEDPASESSRELEREQEVFGNTGVDVVVLYSSADRTVRDAEFRSAVEESVAGFPDGTTAQVVTPWDGGRLNPRLVSTDQQAVQVLVSLSGDGQSEQAEVLDRLWPALASDELEVDIAGPWAVYRGVNETVSEDLARAEMLSLPIVLVLSLLIFGSIVAALMPVIVGAVSVLGALAVVRLLTTFTEVSVFSINVITLLGMGLAIDYALFVVSRYREELAALPETADAPREAIRTTLQTAGRTVLFSGLTVAAALSSLLIFPQNFLRSLGYGGIAAVLIGVVTALTVLPALLLLLGRRVDAGRVRWPGRGRTVGVDSDHGAWARVARAVMRRPVVTMVVIVAGLLVVASPFLGVKWGSVDYRVLPPDHPAHVAAEKINDRFGAETSSANVLLETDEQQAVAAYSRDIAQVPGVVDVSPVAARDGVTVLRATWAGNSQAEKSLDIVRELRAVPSPDGTDALVGGLSASTVDLLSSLRSHLPWMGAIIALVMMVLLFLAFGSLVLPLKAIVMNLLSISASFGVITWIFADGHLEGFLDFTSTGFLDATQPIFMLAILVGLSMDYEVFLLSRVREQWDRTAGTADLARRNADAVAVGVQKTGRIITSAAVLLAVVIGAFSLSSVVFMKMIGVGMLVALLLDATIVRALLVPATMRLLGSWNWWAPGPLRRFWERHGIREHGDPAPPRHEPTGRPRVPVG